MSLSDQQSPLSSSTESTNSTSSKDEWENIDESFIDSFLKSKKDKTLTTDDNNNNNNNNNNSISARKCSITGGDSITPNSRNRNEDESWDGIMESEEGSKIGRNDNGNDDDDDWELEAYHSSHCHHHQDDVISSSIKINDNNNHDHEDGISESLKKEEEESCGGEPMFLVDATKLNPKINCKFDKNSVNDPILSSKLRKDIERNRNAYENNASLLSDGTVIPCGESVWNSALIQLRIDRPGHYFLPIFPLRR